MNCEQMTEMLSAWLDGELTVGEAADMHSHLERCPECRALFEQLQALHTSFSDLEEIPAPEGFAQGVMDRIAVQSKPKVVPLFKRSQVRRLAALAALAACAVLCVGFGHVALNGGFKDASAETAAAPESVNYAADAAMPESTESGTEEFSVMSPAEAAPETESLLEPDVAAVEEPAAPRSRPRPPRGR